MSAGEERGLPTSGSERRLAGRGCSADSGGWGRGARRGCGGWHVGPGPPRGTGELPPLIRLEETPHLGSGQVADF